VQTGPPALLRSQVGYLLLLRFIAARRAQVMSGWRRRREPVAIDFAGFFWPGESLPTFKPPMDWDFAGRVAGRVMCCGVSALLIKHLSQLLPKLSLALGTRRAVAALLCCSIHLPPEVILILPVHLHLLQIILPFFRRLMRLVWDDALRRDDWQGMLGQGAVGVLRIGIAGCR
jgi:hypothetical protein